MRWTSGIGVHPFIDALVIHNPDTKNDWLTLRRPWVQIVLGEVNPVDERHSIDEIMLSDAPPHKPDEGSCPDKSRVTVSVAAKALDVSNTTVLRILGRYEMEYGPRLVQRTKGNQRRIDLRLLEKMRREESQ